VAAQQVPHYIPDIILTAVTDLADSFIWHQCHQAMPMSGRQSTMILQPSSAQADVDTASQQTSSHSHYTSLISTSAGKQAPTRRCPVCCSTLGEDEKKLFKETRYCCTDCDAALCPAPSFQLFHANLISDTETFSAYKHVDNNYDITISQEITQLLCINLHSI